MVGETVARCVSRFRQRLVPRRRRYSVGPSLSDTNQYVPLLLYSWDAKSAPEVKQSGRFHTSDPSSLAMSTTENT